jgi:Cysteine dioxygenase type I
MDAFDLVSVDRTDRLSRRAVAGLALEYSREAVHAARPVLGAGERAFECIRRTDAYDLWIIHWGPGSGTPMHDHGDSVGALSVVHGMLVERRPARTRAGGLRQRTLRAPDRKVMSRSHVHEVANESAQTATSVHVYSPPLDIMHHYEIRPDTAARVVHTELVRPVRKRRLTLT